MEALLPEFTVLAVRQIGRMEGPWAAMAVADQPWLTDATRPWALWAALSSMIEMAYIPGSFEFGVARRHRRRRLAYVRRHRAAIQSSERCKVSAILAMLDDGEDEMAFSLIGSADEPLSARWMERVYGEALFLADSGRHDAHAIERMRRGLGAWELGGDGGVGLVALAEALIGEPRAARRHLEYSRRRAEPGAEQAFCALADIALSALETRGPSDSPVDLERLRSLPREMRVFKICRAARRAYWRVGERMAQRHGEAGSRWLRRERRVRRWFGFPGPDPSGTPFVLRDLAPRHGCATDRW